MLSKTFINHGKRKQSRAGHWDEGIDPSSVSFLSVLDFSLLKIFYYGSGSP